MEAVIDNNKLYRRMSMLIRDNLPKQTVHFNSMVQFSKSLGMSRSNINLYLMVKCFEENGIIVYGEIIGSNKTFQINMAKLGLLLRNSIDFECVEPIIKITNPLGAWKY